MKFVRPLYRSLHQSAVGSAIARETFIQNNEMYLFLFLCFIFYVLK